MGKAEIGSGGECEICHHAVNYSIAFARHGTDLLPKRSDTLGLIGQWTLEISKKDLETILTGSELKLTHHSVGKWITFASPAVFYCR